MDRMIRQGPQQQFFKRSNKQNTTLIQVNNTPIRIRETNKENSHQLNSKKNKDMHQQNKNKFQNDIYNHNKTALKKKNTNSTICSNHPDILANYCIKIDNQYMGYCQKCAAYLASNGFTIQKLTPSGTLFHNKENKSSYSKRKNQLNGFLSSLQQLQKRYIQKDEQMKKMKTSHEIQKETIGNFYASMLQYVEYIKSQHLNFLQEESERFQQINEVQTNQIEETLQEIQAMRQDIESNVDKIIEEVDQQSYSQCMTYYNKQKVNHQHRLKQLKGQSGGMTTSTQMVNQKLNEFKIFMEQLTGINCTKQQQQRLYNYSEQLIDRTL